MRAASWTSAFCTRRLLGKVLGIGEEAVRDEKNLHYIRGLDAAVGRGAQGAAQIAFLLKPTSVQQVAGHVFRRAA